MEALIACYPASQTQETPFIKGRNVHIRLISLLSQALVNTFPYFYLKIYLFTDLTSSWHYSLSILYHCPLFYLILGRYALSNMANHKAIRPNIVNAGGVEPLIHLIKSINPSSEKCSKLIVPATTALSKLIKLDDATCQQVVNSGIIEHLMQVLILW